MIRSLALVVVAVAAFACGPSSTPAPAPVPTWTPTPTPASTSSSVDEPSGPPGIPETGVVTVANVTFIVDIADDDAERAQGLSGRESLAFDGGMWFDREREEIGSFWMRGMLFPIDIVWIDSNLRVVDVTHAAPVPAPGTPLDQLERYSPSRPARYALEINAGLAERFGIQAGSRVEFSRF